MLDILNLKIPRIGNNCARLSKVLSIFQNFNAIPDDQSYTNAGEFTVLTYKKPLHAVFTIQ